MKVWYYGDKDGINTDMLFPGKYTYTCSTAEEVIPHLLEDLDKSFPTEAKAGDLIFAGANFGCGSSREQPVLGLKAVGIKAVIAKGFARIFYRAAVNQGMVLIECADAVKAYKPGCVISIDIDQGRITIDEQTFDFPTLPDEIIAIRKAGGLLPYTEQILSNK